MITQKFNINYFLIILLIIGFTIRIGINIIAPNKIIFGDSIEYYTCARYLNAGYGLINHTRIPTPKSANKKEYLYPVFIAYILRFLPNNFISIIRFIQNVIDTLSILLIYILTIKIFKNKYIGFVASIIYLFYPMMLINSNLLLTETFVVSGMLLFLILYLNYIETNDFFSLLTGALIISYCVHLKGSIQLFVPFLFMLLIIFCKQRIRYIKHAFFIITVLIVVSIPWIIRNYWYHNKFVFNTLKDGIALYNSFNKYNTTGGPLDTYPIEFHFAIDYPIDINTEWERNIYMKNYTIKYVKQNWLKQIPISLKKFLKTWAIIPNNKKYRTPLYIVGIGVPYLFVLVFGILGLLKNIKHFKKPEIIILVSPILYILFLHSIFFGSIRYRTLAIPSLIIFSAFAIYHIIWSNLCILLGSSLPKFRK